MAAVKRVLPAIMIANDLLDGDVVFLATSGWSRDPAHAQIATDNEAAERFEAAARMAMAARQIVDASLIDVTIQPDGRAVPNHFRERFRVLGPTHRTDLGKQAEFPTSGGRNV